MATNPLYNNNDSPNAATQPTKAVNQQGVYVPRTHNTYDNSYWHFTTQKFAQYEPFFMMEVVPGDIIPFSSNHDVRSLPMSSPFLSQLKLNKDYFMVPLNAILPNTWDYIYKLPSQGDDVPEDANCLFPLFYNGYAENDRNFITSLFDLYNHKVNDGDYVSAFRVLLILEMFCSQGSLLAKCGFHLNPLIETNTGSIISFDEFFDTFIRSISEVDLTVTTDSGSFTYSSSSDNYSPSVMVSLLRNHGSQCLIGNLTFSNEDALLFNSVSGLPDFSNPEGFGADINISRILAYQLACSQYFVNPQVDYIYTAQLYRDNVFNLYRDFANSLSANFVQEYFTMNGISIPYDVFSKHNFVGLMEGYFSSSFSEFTSDVLCVLYDLMFALFGFRETLRFGDYFTDSRTQALAIGNDDVSVQADNTVSVVDIRQNIIMQRFRNAVVKLRGTFGDYLRGIMGTAPAPDFHFPKYIIHQEFNIGGFEVANNTSDGQGDLVTNLNSSEDTYVFELEVDMPSIVIGMSYFTVPRVYMQTKDRHFFHRDRYDMFNPMLQYLGDQIVYNIERTDRRPNSEIFGYQSRNNEYKQRYSIATGGFATKLPAWSFVTDSLYAPVVDIEVSDYQSPDFIRAHDYEFDRFFAALSGFSLANSFHFIVVYNNQCMSMRPMEVNPDIL